MARNPNASYESSNHQRDPVTLYTNNLNATVSGTGLDAVQGKILNDKITALSARKSGSFSKAVSAKTVTTIDTITVPSVGSAYLVLTRMSLNASGTSAYNHYLGGAIVRSTEINGGGSVNYIIVSAGASVAVKAYVNMACTVTVTYLATCISA